MKKLAEGDTQYTRSKGEAWLGKPLTCPKCGGTFELEAEDFEESDGPYRPGESEAVWNVTLTARTPGGEQRIAGKCPWCNEAITFTGNNATGPRPIPPLFVRDGGRAVDRASLPYAASGVRWYRGRKVGWGDRARVIAAPLDGMGSAMIVAGAGGGSSTLYHAIGRRDGKIAVDMVVSLDDYDPTVEAEASRSDAELVDFVARLNLGGNTARRLDRMAEADA